MDAPKLRISQWQQALDNVSPHLNRFQNDLNAISEDIKALEKYLTESGFRIRVDVSAGGFNDSIAWTDIGSGAKTSWRIAYVERDDRDDQVVQQRPLIEMPASVRWRTADKIPSLLNEIAEVAARVPESVDSVSAPSDDDIPF